MTATRPGRVPLVGRYVRLDPYTDAELPALWRALGHPEVHAGGYGGGPAGLPADEAAYAEWAPRYFPHERGITYVVRIASGPHRGEVVGASSMADFDEARETAHIGWTAYDPRVWGTQVNVEAKLLMLGHLFDHGFGRVKLQADAANERSRAAIAKLGASFEGIARRDQRRADGSWRDAAIFSVLVTEWPEVRAGLERRLGDWGERPVLYRSVPSG
ncbi:MAG: N-acetyltransferase [Leifsonia xyli]|nr:MAG: N-acetyltransferase [Leifsonia xyli]